MIEKEQKGIDIDQLSESPDFPKNLQHLRKLNKEAVLKEADNLFDFVWYLEMPPVMKVHLFEIVKNSERIINGCSDSKKHDFNYFYMLGYFGEKEILTGC